MASDSDKSSERGHEPGSHGEEMPREAINTGVPMHKVILIAFGVGLLGGFLGNVVHGLFHSSDQAKIAVVRPADFLNHFMHGKKVPDPGVASAALMEMRRQAKAMAKQGYIVLNDNDVLDAPSGAFIKPN